MDNVGKRFYEQELPDNEKSGSKPVGAGRSRVERSGGSPKVVSSRINYANNEKIYTLTL